MFHVLLLHHLGALRPNDAVGAGTLSRRPRRRDSNVTVALGAPCKGVLDPNMVQYGIVYGIVWYSTV